ncbi:hypothetical protein [Paenalkalicoccus suaedae]|nr:hypothetical protein [Paenalkalicoccus suaedae]
MTDEQEEIILHLLDVVTAKGIVWVAIIIPLYMMFSFLKTF